MDGIEPEDRSRNVAISMQELSAETAEFLPDREQQPPRLGGQPPGQFVVIHACSLKLVVLAKFTVL